MGVLDRRKRKAPVSWRRNSPSIVVACLEGVLIEGQGESEEPIEPRPVLCRVKSFNGL